MRKFILRDKPLPVMFLAWAVVAMLMVQTSDARQPGPDYRSVVLVLKLVSATHVKPVTGIVLSDDGLVLVPADFVSAASGSTENEIVVLDGGTDIFSHGRPAKVINSSVAGGLAVLSVEGLKRPGITLSESSYGMADQLHLAAFPPAEYIASGSDPLWVPVKAVTGPTAGKPAIAAETPLPYVTGAILDACGYLAGLSMTSGAQNLETLKTPVVTFAGELDRLLQPVQTGVRSAICDPGQSPLESTAGSGDLDSGIEASDPGGPVQVAKSVEQLQLEEVASAPQERPQEALQPPLTASARSLVAKPPSLWRSIPVWLIASTLLVSIVAAWKIVVFIRLHKNVPGQAAGEKSKRHHVQAASDEPDTTQLQTAAEAPLPAPRSGRMDEGGVPDLNDLPDGCNGIVMIEGLLDAGTGFRRFCAVNADHFNIVVGRGDTDISIEHPAVSRNHAGIEYANESMILSDLGSSNGTFIGDVPCLPGEVMYVERDDEVFLGEVRFNIKLIRKEADLS